MAQKLFISQRTVSAYEKGQRQLPIDLLPKLAEIFDCSIDKIVRSILGLEIEKEKQTK